MSSQAAALTLPRCWLLTRDPVADRIGSVVVAGLIRTRHGLVSELVLTTDEGSDWADAEG